MTPDIDPTLKLTRFMILAGYFTPAYLVTAAVLLFYPGVLTSWAAKISFILIWIYGVPPLLCRVTLILRPIPLPLRALHTERHYNTWWLLTQYQMLFNRLGFLEELLRLLPGIYALWLITWGSKVSAFAYWSPGIYVTDRYLLNIAHGCVIGSRSMICAHLLSKSAEGYELTLAPITLEQQCICGFNTVLGPGCRIGAGEVFPAQRVLPPFTTWEQGKRIPETKATDQPNQDANAEKTCQ
ncbi:MAG: hypothetical protein OEZ68_19095 [Gammaproteobacteria bacterium]|nr:hypothetical protein [Gammaproteobacteria bacterium]MDH5802915.1 hypothetical protein [Gammaproteobacteria bacterium]